jgi:hypothetical protein
MGMVVGHALEYAAGGKGDLSFQKTDMVLLG